MNVAQLIQLIGAILVLACILKLMRDRWRYRAKWIITGNWYFAECDKHRQTRMDRAVAVLNEKHWRAVAERGNARHAEMAKTVTDLSVTIDALMNGDRRCVDGHRYYASMGARCPNCGGKEIVDLSGFVESGDGAIVLRK